jgi:hypothetical protein
LLGLNERLDRAANNLPARFANDIANQQQPHAANSLFRINVESSGHVVAQM